MHCTQEAHAPLARARPRPRLRILLGVVLLTESVNQGFYHSCFYFDAKVYDINAHKDSICMLELLNLNPI